MSRKVLLVEDQGEQAMLLRTADDPQEASRWSLSDLAIDPGHVGAVAVQGPSVRLQCWRWSDA